MFGSDPPYGFMPGGVVLTERAARSAGYNDAELAALFGGNAARLLLGREGNPSAPRERERPRGVDGFRAGEDPSFMRAVSYTAAAFLARISGGSGSEALWLAYNALEVPDTHPAAADAAELRQGIELMAALLAGPEEWMEPALRFGVVLLAQMSTAQLGVAPVCAVE